MFTTCNFRPSCLYARQNVEFGLDIPRLHGHKSQNLAGQCRKMPLPQGSAAIKKCACLKQICKYLHELWGCMCAKNALLNSFCAVFCSHYQRGAVKKVELHNFMVRRPRRDGIINSCFAF